MQSEHLLVDTLC